MTYQELQKKVLGHLEFGRPVWEDLAKYILPRTVKKRKYFFNRKLHEKIDKLEEEVSSLKSNVTEHVTCNHCNIIGHKKDMFNSGWDTYYHYGCYAEKFNKHLCPCKCGKWIDNKKKKQ